MTHDEYRITLSRLGLNGTAAAALIGVCTRTEIRWATGRVPVPKPIQRLLMLIERVGDGNAERIFQGAPIYANPYNHHLPDD